MHSFIFQTCCLSWGCVLVDVGLIFACIGALHCTSLSHWSIPPSTPFLSPHFSIHLDIPLSLRRVGFIPVGWIALSLPMAVWTSKVPLFYDTGPGCGHPSPLIPFSYLLSMPPSALIGARSISVFHPHWMVPWRLRPCPFALVAQVVWRDWRHTRHSGHCRPWLWISRRCDGRILSTPGSVTSHAALVGGIKAVWASGLSLVLQGRCFCPRVSKRLVQWLRDYRPHALYSSLKCHPIPQILFLFLTVGFPWLYIFWTVLPFVQALSSMPYFMAIWAVYLS